MELIRNFCDRTQNQDRDPSLLPVAQDDMAYERKV